MLFAVFSLTPVFILAQESKIQVSSIASLPKLDGVGKKSSFITLKEAQSLALEGNATLKSQQLSLEDARRNAQSSWNAFLPGININGGISNNHGITDGSTNSWNWNASAGLSLSLTAGIPVQMKLAALGYEMAQTSYEMQLQTIMANVSSSFYNLVTEAENLKVLEDNLNLTRQQYEEARRNYNRGLASELEMLRAQYAYVSSEPQLEQAKTKYEANLATFQILLGSEEQVIPQDEFQLRELALPDAETLAQQQVENRLDVIQKRQVLREAELKKTSESLLGRAPSISLSENIRMNPKGGSMDGEPSVDGSFSVGVSIPVDGFIPGSSKSLSMKRAGDAVTTAQLNLDTSLAQAHQDIVTKVSEIGLLWHAIEIAELNESIATRAYQLSQEGYRAGLVSQTDLENTRQQMVSAQLAAGTSQSQYLVGVKNLANALGMTVEQVYELYGVKEDESG